MGESYISGSKRSLPIGSVVVPFARANRPTVHGFQRTVERNFTIRNIVEGFRVSDGSALKTGIILGWMPRGD